MDNKDCVLNLLDIIKLFEKNAKRIDQDSKEIFSLNFRILTSIYRLGKPSQKQIVEDIDLAKSNVANFCKGLIEKGLIATKTDEKDKRMVYYELTIEGKKKVESVSALGGKLLEYLPQTKQDKFERFAFGLQKLLEDIERESRDAKID